MDIGCDPDQILFPSGGSPSLVGCSGPKVTCSVETDGGGTVAIVPFGGWKQWWRMTKYVIGADVAIRLARSRAEIREEHQILAPTLIRSQILSLLYQAVRRAELTKKDAEQHLDYLRGLRIRLLGDRVLQSVAWKVADQLGWDSTFDAEYVALTQLHADALITLDDRLADAARKLVVIAPIEELS